MKYEKIKNKHLKSRFEWKLGKTFFFNKFVLAPEEINFFQLRPKDAQEKSSLSW